MSALAAGGAASVVTDAACGAASSTHATAPPPTTPTANMTKRATRSSMALSPEQRDEGPGRDGRSVRQRPAARYAVALGPADTAQQTERPGYARRPRHQLCQRHVEHRQDPAR